MPTRRLSSAALAACIGVACAARAEEATAGRSTVYPLTARLLFLTQSKGCFRLYPAQQPASNRICRIPLTFQTREAFAEALRRLFRPPEAGREPDLLFEISVAQSDAVTLEGLQGDRSFVTPIIVVSTSEDAEVARLRPQGSSDLLGLGRESIQAAFGLAVKDSARLLEHEFSNSEDVVRWLLARNVKPVGSTVTWPPRGSLVGFFDGGAGAMHRTDGFAPTVMARLGIAGRWFAVQATAESWTAPLDKEGNIQATDVGVELGPVVPLNRNWEVRAGGGLHSVWGTLTPASRQPYDYSRLTPTAFAALQYTYWPGWKSPARLRFGLEVREHFSRNANFPALQRMLSLVDTSASIFFGVEVPFFSAPPDAALRPE